VVCKVKSWLSQGVGRFEQRVPQRLKPRRFHESVRTLCEPRPGGVRDEKASWGPRQPQADAGSFDSVNGLAGESIHCAQDDRVKKPELETVLRCGVGIRDHLFLLIPFGLWRGPAAVVAE
jgi:hypothetical protein